MIFWDAELMLGHNIFQTQDAFPMPLVSSQAVSAEWLYVGEPGEFRGSRRLQSIVERSQMSCHVVEHDFGVSLGG